MGKIQERQKLIRLWQDQTGEAEIDMHAVAQMAMRMGYRAPPPVSDEDRLVKLLKDAAKQDIRHDRKTGRPYHAYHAFPQRDASGQFHFPYIDIDEPKTKPEHFRKSCVMRREQSIDDVTALRLDQHHWNDNRPDAQQVEILTADMEFDVDLRLASMDDKDKAA